MEIERYFIWILSISILRLYTCVKQHNFSVHLLQMEPYVGKRGNEVVGIVPQQLKIINKKCENINIHMEIVPWSMEEMKDITKSSHPLDLLRTKKQFNESENIVLGALNYDHLDPVHKHFIAIPIAHSKGLAGIVHRDTIGLGVKLYEAMYDSVLIIYNGVLLAAVFGVVLWCVVGSFSF